MLCRGFAKSTQAPCRKDAVRGSAYCALHVTQCRGRKLDGGKCVARQKPGYDYCCADHDPAQRALYVAPSLFKQSDLRKTKLHDIVRLHDQRDVYHGDTLPTSMSLTFELDHKLELQCAAYAVREAAIEDADTQAVVVAFLRDDVLNQDENLCFTRKTTNALKGSAARTFMDDMRTGHVGAHSTFTDYMLAQAPPPSERRTSSGGRLERAVTKRIRNEMKKANKACVNKLKGEDETPSFRAVKRQFQKLNIAMNE